MAFPRAHALLLLWIPFLVGCSALPLPSTPQVELSSPANPERTLPAAQVTFNVEVPEAIPEGERVELIFLDEVTGLDYNVRRLTLDPQEGGTWGTTAQLPLGALQRYRYHRRGDTDHSEASALGEAVRARVINVDGPMVIRDRIEAWDDLPFEGETGTVEGVIREAETGEPLAEMVVVAAGRWSFSDGLGGFRIDGLSPGLHRVTILSPFGEHLPRHQGAEIAAGAVTPTAFSLEPAEPITVSFEITVPAGTPADVPLRIAGNVASLGHLFTEPPGGLRGTAMTMPTAVRVDDTHFLALLSLYAGTDLRYKYTLGNGLWNSERNSAGFFRTREIILPQEDLALQDTVESWTGELDPVNFLVTVPPSTPSGNQIGIQFNPFTWFDPLPMTRVSPDQWSFPLLNPLDESVELHYRYCRNLQCGIADDVDTAGSLSGGRILPPPASIQQQLDAVEDWRWWVFEDDPITIIAPEIEPRPEMLMGVELLPTYEPTWRLHLLGGLDYVAGAGSNAVVFSPAWVASSQTEYPNLAFNPSHSPLRRDLIRDLKMAQDLGLTTVIRPTLLSQSGDLASWWSESFRTAGWWQVWQERYRAFLMTYAQVAAETGASGLILGGSEVHPALPEGVLLNGLPSNPPEGSDVYWRDLIRSLREVFPGELYFEVEVGLKPVTVPAFVESLDGLFVYWHAALSESPTSDVALLQSSARVQLDALLSMSEVTGLPLFLSVEYLSVQGSSTACPLAPDLSCRTAAEFDQGAAVDPDLAVNLREQASAYNALLLEAYPRQQIQGFFARRYNPIVALRDKSASVNGKPAADVIWYWYPLVTAGP